MNDLLDLILCKKVLEEKCLRAHQEHIMRTSGEKSTSGIHPDLPLIASWTSRCLTMARTGPKRHGRGQKNIAGPWIPNLHGKREGKTKRETERETKKEIEKVRGMARE